MTSDSSMPPVNVPQNQLLERAKVFWLKFRQEVPANPLPMVGGRTFAPTDDVCYRDLSQVDGIGKLKLDEQQDAILMGLERYESVLALHDLCRELIEQLDALEINQQTDPVERLYRNITSLKSRLAADALMVATSEDFRESFQPNSVDGE